ncbi:hypothetical protein [Leptospira kobayashii]|nr:hypothetical protein [Leptospira kobayashii]
MKQNRPLSILFLISLLLSFSSLSAREVPSGGEMLLDIALARPLGLAGTCLGVGAFIISFPFSALSGTIKQSSKRLVLYPAKFTFTRGLGDFPGYMEPYEIVEE